MPRTLKLGQPHPGFQFRSIILRIQVRLNARASTYEGYLGWLNAQLDHGTDESIAAQPHQGPPRVARGQTLDAPSAAPTVPALSCPGHRPSNMAHFSGASRLRAGLFNTMPTPPPSPQQNTNLANAALQVYPGPSDPVPTNPPWSQVECFRPDANAYSDVQGFL